jgi:hypothetical protein
MRFYTEEEIEIFKTYYFDKGWKYGFLFGISLCLVMLIIGIIFK